MSRRAPLPVRLLLWAALGGLVWGHAGHGGADAAPPLPGAIDAALERGVAWLVDEERAGAFGTGSRRVGHTALAAFALVHAGARPDGATAADRCLQRALRLLEREGPGARAARDDAGTYETALTLLLLRDLGWTPARRERAAACVGILEAAQAQNGQWSYGGGAAGRPQAGDNSNTQFAVLALGAAAGEGLAVDAQGLRRARRWWLAALQEDGGFGYASGGSTRSASTGSMTAAGVCALAILDAALGEPTSLAARERAVARLAAGFEVDKNFGPAQGAVAERQRNAGRGWLHYFLWSVERAMVLAGRERLGEHDWYAEGARHLLDTQKRDGSWRGEHPLYATCFALLFLTRAADPPRAFTPPATRGPVTPRPGDAPDAPPAGGPPPQGTLEDLLVRETAPDALAARALADGPESLLVLVAALDRREAPVRRRAHEALVRLLGPDRVAGADRHPLHRGRLALWIRQNLRALEIHDGGFRLAP